MKNLAQDQIDIAFWSPLAFLVQYKRGQSLKDRVALKTVGGCLTWLGANVSLAVLYQIGRDVSRGKNACFPLPYLYCTQLNSRKTRVKREVGMVDDVTLSLNTHNLSSHAI